MSAKKWKFFMVVFFVVFFDRLTKTVIDGIVDPGSSIAVTSFLDIVNYRNPGIAFGMLSDLDETARAAVFGGAFLAVILFAFLFFRESGRSRIFIACILGGAIGNTIDRFVFGFVIDFLDFHWTGSYAMHWPAFNIADMFITLGAAGLVVSLLWKAYKGVLGNS